MTGSFLYAGFWLRVLSHLIDSLLLGAVQLALILPLAGIAGLGLWGMDIEHHPEGILLVLPLVLALMLLAFLGGWLYYAIMESSASQGTIGKLVVRLRVTDMKGDRITFGRASARYFSRILSGLFFGIGFLMAGFSQQKQALHDIIAGTLVLQR